MRRSGTSRRLTGNWRSSYILTETKTTRKRRTNLQTWAQPMRWVLFVATVAIAVVDDSKIINPMHNSASAPVSCCNCVFLPSFCPCVVRSGTFALIGQLRRVAASDLLTLGTTTFSISTLVEGKLSIYTFVFVYTHCDGSRF